MRFDYTDVSSVLVDVGPQKSDQIVPQNSRGTHHLNFYSVQIFSDIQGTYLLKYIKGRIWLPPKYINYVTHIIYIFGNQILTQM